MGNFLSNKRQTCCLIFKDEEMDGQKVSIAVDLPKLDLLLLFTPCLMPSWGPGNPGNCATFDEDKPLITDVLHEHILPDLPDSEQHELGYLGTCHIVCACVSVMSHSLFGYNPCGIWSCLIQFIPLLFCSFFWHFFQRLFQQTYMPNVSKFLLLFEGCKLTCFTHSAPADMP